MRGCRSIAFARAAGLGSWAGQLGWAAGPGNWTGQLGWAAGLGSWAGQLGWAAGLGSWAGQPQLGWAAGLGNWAGQLGWAAGPNLKHEDTHCQHINEMSNEQSHAIDHTGSKNKTRKIQTCFRFA